MVRLLPRVLKSSILLSMMESIEATSPIGEPRRVASDGQIDRSEGTSLSIADSVVPSLQISSDFSSFGLGRNLS